LQSLHGPLQQSQNRNYPLGTRKLRDELIRTREFHDWKTDREINIAQEGEAIRILGSWQGNGISIQAKWNEITERQARTMKRWSLLYPSIAERVLITKALVVSLDYYLMTVSGIPEVL